MHYRSAERLSACAKVPMLGCTTDNCTTDNRGADNCGTEISGAEKSGTDTVPLLA